MGAASSDRIMERVVPLLLFVFALPSWNTRLISVADAQIITVVSSSETEVTFQFSPGYSSSYCSYTLYYYNKGSMQTLFLYPNYLIPIYRAQFLSPGTRYNFNLYINCDNNYYYYGPVTGVTAPLNVDHVSVTQLNDGHVTLMWYIVNNDFRYSYILKYGVFEIPIRDFYNQSSLVTYTDSYLFPETTYDFTLYTVFEGVRSSGYNFSVTFPVRSCDGPWWDSAPALFERPPFGNEAQYGLQVNGTRFRKVSVDFRAEAVSITCRTKGVLAVLTVVAVGLTLIIILIFVFLCINRKISGCRSCRTDHIYENSS